MVISGDLLVEPSFVHSIIDLHLSQNSTFTVALKRFENQGSDGSNIRAGDIIGTEPNNNRLLFIASSDDYVNSPLKIKNSLLDSFNNIRFEYNILDAHFYLISRSAMVVLEKQKHIHSLKHDFLPFLLRCQYRPTLVQNQKQNNLKPLNKNYDNLNELDIFEDTQDLVSNMSSSFHDTSLFKCLYYMIPDGQYCNRANTISSYTKSNFDISGIGSLHIKSLSKGKNINNGSSYGSKTTVSNDCIIGDYSAFGNSTQVKFSIIGKHCKIGNNVKIIHCVIMDHVTIEDNSNLKNCTISSSSFISSGSSLQDCTVGNGYNTLSNSSHNKESLSSQTNHI